MVRNKCCKLLLYLAVLLSIGIGCIFAAFAAKHLGDSVFVADTYCQLNSIKKTELDIVDDTLDNVCSSEIVLAFGPKDLKPPLLGVLYLHAIVGPCLVLTGLLALVGLCRTSARLIWPWLVLSVCWCITLVVTAAVLGWFGFGKYAYILLAFLAVAIVSVVGVGYFAWQIPRQGSYKLEFIPLRNFKDGELPDGEPQSADTV